MNKDWDTEPRKQAEKVQRHDVLKVRCSVIGYVYDPNGIEKLPIKYALNRIISRRSGAEVRFSKKP